MRLVSNIRLEPSRRSSEPAAVSATRGSLRIYQQEQAIAFESSFERDLLVMCGGSPQVRSVVREPFSIRYLDLSTGAERTYTPDFLVALKHGGLAWELLVEVKRECDRHRFETRSAAAFDAAQLWAEQRSRRTFAVVTDEWMNRSGLERFALINAFARTPFTISQREMIVGVVAGHSAPTVLMVCQCLGESLGKPWNEAMPVMLALVARGNLSFDVRQTLTLETAIHAGNIDCPFAGVNAGRISGQCGGVKPGQ